MDTRTALKTGTLLKLSNGDGAAAQYTIQKEIGRGGSCIVYHASYRNNAGNIKTVHIKECYPFKLRITREDSGALIPDECDRQAFEECKKRAYDAFYISDELFYTSGLTNSISNTIDIYVENNTVYIVSVYVQGKTLLHYSAQSLKESISLVKSAAAVIQRIHKKGYLYLDVTPQNIFVIEGTTEIVQLFDFDSLVPVYGINTDDKTGNDKISYTEGFAALELQMGKFKKLGTYTDVYGVGALLFYLLFGYAPDAPACEADAVYDFAAFKFAHQEYQDGVFPLLTDFFHHTLANYYPDRYQDMEQVIQKLDDIEQYADTTVPYILSTRISCPNVLVGREHELEKLDSWFGQDESNCLFLTGMGGIGKSTLIRKYLAMNRFQFDTVLYLHDTGSVQRMLADDSQVSINTVRKREEEDISDYFCRKFNIIRKLTAEKRTVFVIDDFCGEADEDFQLILNAGWKVVVITRRDMSAQNFDTLNLKAISKRQDLYSLFEIYAQRKVQKQEYMYLDDIIDRLLGHTLALVLIAGQVANSCLTIREAAVLVSRYGFSKIAPEKVDYVKGQAVYHETIANIITALFDVSNLPADKKRILKLLSLFQMPEVDIHIFQQLLALDTKDGLNELKRDGWISIEDKMISLHPVIRECICRWEWSEKDQAAAFRVMKEIYKHIKLENLTVQFAEAVLDGCRNETFLHGSGIYRKLLYHTVLNMPREREAYILAHADELLEEPGCFNANAVLNLFELVATIYGERKDYKAAYAKIMEAEAYVQMHPDSHAFGQYYFMLAGFYDDRLAGEYVIGEGNDDCINLLQALNKAIFYMKSSGNADSKLLLAKYELSKAMVLLRSGFGKKKEIRRLFGSVKKAIKDDRQGRFKKHKQDCPKEYKRLCTEVISGYYMGMAWYYTLIEPDFAAADVFINKACKIEKKTSVSDLDFIDSILIPHANILAELQMDDMSAAVIKNGIQICENYKDIIPYMRKKMELYGCLLDMGIEGRNISKEFGMMSKAAVKQDSGQ